MEKLAAHAQNCTYSDPLVPISSDYLPIPPHFYHCLCSLCTLILLFLLLHLLIPVPAFSLSAAICFPASSPMRAEGSSASGAGRLPGCTSGVWAFPALIFQETCWPSLTTGSRWAFCKCPWCLAGSLAAQTRGLRELPWNFKKRNLKKKVFIS